MEFEVVTEMQYNLQIPYLVKGEDPPPEIFPDIEDASIKPLDLGYDIVVVSSRHINDFHRETKQIKELYGPLTSKVDAILPMSNQISITQNRGSIQANSFRLVVALHINGVFFNLP